jgi:hypothetical protein
MTKLLSIEEFRDMARKNPDTAENYIYNNQQELEAQGLIKEFDSIVDYWINMWQAEHYQRAIEQAFYQRMDYR